MRCSCHRSGARSAGLAAGAMMAFAASAIAQTGPVSATGWNRDIVVEASAAQPYSSAAQSFDVPNNFAFYENALPGSLKGLPFGGSFSSLLDGTAGQFQPYTGPNALFMSATGASGTLTLLPAAQRPYNRLTVFAVSANGGGTGTVVLNFADGSSSVPMSYNAQDWFFVTANNALNNLGRIGLTGGVDDGSQDNPRIYQTTIDLAIAGQNLQSVLSLTFTKPAAAATSVVMAISGEVNASATGVCCASDGTCTLTNPGGCVGAFHTEWADCGVAQCPQPSSCCFDDGSCSVMQAADCAAAGGQTGASAACTPNDCPQPGACCAPDSACSIAQGPDCTASNGFFMGAGTTCTPNNCPPLPWACCFADGSCLALTGTDCTANSGTWNVGQTCGQAYCAGENLLVNPGAETNDMTGWTVDLNGGNGWATDFDDLIHSGSHSFSTSYTLCVRHQEVDLLGAGFSESLLDSAPSVAFSEWVASRFDNGARYFVTFDLLDAGRAVIATFTDGDQTTLTQLSPGTAYFQVAHTFTGYGPGLRYLRITDGGQDVNVWAGNYGPHFDDASAGIVLPRACCLPGGVCQIATIGGCLSADGATQGAGSACTPGLCPGGGNGACCAGATCSVVDAGACSGPNTQFIAGAACNAPGNNTSPCCKADYNHSGSVTVQDIFDFLGGYFTANPAADINASGGVTVQDIFDFLGGYFTGCA